MIEIFSNKYFIIGAAILFGVILYQLLTKKDKFSQKNDSDYSEVINSDKYKVKSQFDD